MDGNAAEGVRSGEVFLTAEWRNLAMLNYEVDPALLSGFIPSGTELDLWNGKALISLVGFQFLQTRVRGIAVPFHRNFDEVNLRFYVQRIVDGEVRRGVVFIREIVPRWAIAALARGVYNENYVCLPMSHRIAGDGEERTVEYAWRTKAGWSRLSMRTEGALVLPAPGSEAQFITEHYWGYSVQKNGGTKEYRVAHPGWRVWRGSDAKFEGDAAQLYGRELAAVILTPPSSAFLAEGSPVVVGRGKKI